MTAGNFISASVPASGQTVVGWNRQVYQRLKLAFRLGLRRQIFIGVCDDPVRRDGIAARLQAELELESPQVSSYPPLITLRLEEGSEPNPIARVRDWLARNPPRDLQIPGFQIVGVERLTRQPAPVQWSFLNHLRSMPQDLQALDSSLLLWVPQPWLYSIEQSAPEFWQFCTGIFEFRGDPLVAEEEALWQEETAEIDPHPVELPSPELENDRPQQQTAFQYVDGELVAEVLSSLEDGTPAKSVELLEQIEQLHRLHAPATLLVEHYQHLGQITRDRIESGDASVATIRIAILAYEQAIKFWREMPSADAAIRERVLSILNDLGTLYWMLSRMECKPELKGAMLEHSVCAYQAALEFIDSQSWMWSPIQNNLGGVYGDLAACGEAADNWQRAIDAFTAALSAANLDRPQYAAIQNNLGTAYWNLAQHCQPAPHLQQAIAAYTEALSWDNRDSDPLGYAAIQNNLGTAYWNLSQHEEPDLYLRLAIEAYGQALRYRTPQTCPMGCAATQNNLGTAFWQLADRTQEDANTYSTLLEGAIAAYETAIELTISHHANSTFDRFATHNNLGLAHYQLVTHPHYSGNAIDRRSHLEASLRHHLQALAAWKSDPQRYQMALEFVVQTTRAFYNDGDIQGQNLAFSQLPPGLLPEVMQLF